MSRATGGAPGHEMSKHGLGQDRFSEGDMTAQPSEPRLSEYRPDDEINLLIRRQYS